MRVRGESSESTLANTARVRRKRKLYATVAAGFVAFVMLLVLVFEAGAKQASGIAMLVLIGSIIAAMIRPVCGLYAIVFFTLVGDSETSQWFPFVKNMSSAESLLYVANPLVISPLEMLVGVTFVMWLIDVLADRRRIITVNLVWATAAFTVFVALGFMYGISNGGDIRIALFEGRALFLLLPVFVLILNLCDERHVRALTWTAFVAIVINALLALLYLFTLPRAQAQVREALGEHSASTHFNAVIILALAFYLYRGGTRIQRNTLLIMLLPVLVTYAIAQRRAAVAGLVVAIALMMLSLFWRNKRTFSVVVPLTVFLGLGYTGAFWNSTSTAGFPAQAVKSVIAPDSVSEEDRSSDVYREIESFDLNYTIRNAPLFGMGFGRPFMRPYPLPDISFFEFHEYIPHNSVLWVWVKTGFGGIGAFFAMIAIAVRAAARSIATDPDPTSASYRMLGAGYVVSFVLFAYVDIAFDPRTMVFLALAFALCTIRPRRAAPPGRPPDDATSAPSPLELRPLRAPVGAGYAGRGVDRLAS